MRVVDDVGLPEQILRAIANDPYDRGDADISVTGLIKPPMMRALEKEYDALIEEPASGRIYALLGKAVHAILEMAQMSGSERYIQERRFFTEEGGMKISGQIDLIDLRERTLHDFKVCSRWVGIFGAKDEWEQQLNLYRLLAFRNGVQIDRLKIHAIYRDWSLRDAMTKEDYPKKQIETFDLPVWDIERTERFLISQVHKHLEAEAKLASSLSADELLPIVCTKDERWDRGDSYAIKHRGKKRAIRVLSSMSEATAWKNKNQRPGETLEIEHRPGNPTRCMHYCSVKKWCPFGSRLIDE